VKLVLFALLFGYSTVFAHSITPAWQTLRMNERAEYGSFYVDVSNIRRDVSSFVISVEDFESGEQIAFSSTDRIFKLGYEEAKRVRIFVRNEKRQRLKVCTWAKSTATAQGKEQAIMSAVCSGVHVRYFQ
jgi:hypothetical protein